MNQTLPTQVSRSQVQRRKAQPMNSTTKIGAEKLSADRRMALAKSFYQRKVILTVPKDILDANPDKHFVFVNMTKMQQSGFYHPQGYRLYQASKDSESMANEKFNANFDGLVHRNEMVLAYLPKEEFEERELERQAAQDMRNLTELITHNEAMNGFSPFGQETVEQVSYPVKAPGVKE